MSTRGDVVAVTCLALEARIALGPGVSVICTHASKLVAALERAAKRGASGIISFGIAGGLAPHLAAGDWVVGSGVRTEAECFPTDRAWALALLAALPGAVHAEIIGADAPVAHPTEKRRLHAQTGAVAVDNESHVAARIAAAYRIPFAACRAVIDPAHSELPPAAVTGLRHDGTADVLAVLRSVVRQPSQLPALARTALEARTAGAALRRGRRLLGVGLAFPYFREVTLDVPAAVEAI
jgi:hopanoid-associated phosphorylase